MRLREEKRHLFAKQSFHDLDQGLKECYYVNEAAATQRYHEQGMYKECNESANRTLGGDDRDRPSEAIQARMHMLLARKEVEPDSASRK